MSSRFPIGSDRTMRLPRSTDSCGRKDKPPCDPLSFNDHAIVFDFDPSTLPNAGRKSNDLARNQRVLPKRTRQENQNERSDSKTTGFVAFSALSKGRLFPCPVSRRTLYNVKTGNCQLCSPAENTCGRHLSRPIWFDTASGDSSRDSNARQYPPNGPH
jgi:hypothetical protein